MHIELSDDEASCCSSYSPDTKTTFVSTFNTRRSELFSGESGALSSPSSWRRCAPSMRSYFGTPASASNRASATRR